MNKIILVDLVDLVALGFLFGPQDILGQKGPLEYINVNYIPENCLKARVGQHDIYTFIPTVFHV